MTAGISLAAIEEAIATSVRDEPDVLAGYLFGSRAAGVSGPLSDIDVALLLSPSATREAVIGRVTDALCRTLRTDRIDVVALADVPTPVAYRAIRDGRRVMSRDDAAVQRFVVRTVLDYLDFKPLRERAFATQRRAILAASDGRRR